MNWDDRESKLDEKTEINKIRHSMECPNCRSNTWSFCCFVLYNPIAAHKIIISARLNDSSPNNKNGSIQGSGTYWSNNVVESTLASDFMTINGKINVVVMENVAKNSNASTCPAVDHPSTLLRN